MKYLVLLLLAKLSQPVLASTFIGNGGNAGDVEREVTLQQILGAIEGFAQHNSIPQCECVPRYQNSSFCDTLKTLNEQQQQFCSKTLKTLSTPLKQVLAEDQVRFSWTDQSIRVKEGGSLRAVDAVTDPSQNKITIHLNGFLGMNDSQRVFLLSHELVHLMKYQGSHLNDTGSIGPFDGRDGKRKLINAMSASVVMAAYKKRLFKKYENTLDRPKPWKKHRLEAGVTGVSIVPSDSDTNVYANDSMSGGHLLYRYQSSSPWGGHIAYKYYSEEKTILTSIAAKESLNGGAVGVSYRLFPFKDPLSFLGHSHLIFEMQVEYYRAEYTVNDKIVSAEETTDALGGALNCKYYMPLGIGIWVYLGLGAGQLNYQFNTFGVKYDSPRTHTTIGVSYGF